MAYSRPGRSQAGHPPGLPGSIGDTIGEMGAPGEQYVDTFRRSMAPTPKMDDSSSLQEYATWARRNGYNEEADKYMALALRQKEVEKVEAQDRNRANILADGASGVASAKGLGAEGDVRALDLTMEKLKGQLAVARKSGDPAAVEAVARQMSEVGAQRPGASSVKAKKGAAAIDSYQQMLDGMSADDPNREGLEKALNYLKSDPEVQAAYREIEKEKLSVSSAQNTVTIQEDTIEDNAYDRSRRETAEQLEALQLDSAWNKAASDRAALQDRANETEGKALSATLAAQGIYDPSQLPKDLDPAVRAHAVSHLNDERNAQEQSNNMKTGKLTPFYESTARSLAYEEDGVTIKNPALAALMSDYDRIHSQDTLNPGEATRTTGLIFNAVKTQQEKALAGVGDTKYKAAGQLSTFRDMPQTDGLFEGGTYKEALKDEAAFNEMRDGLATYMVENGITEFATTTELYSAMDVVAPTLSSSNTWQKVTNQNERLRDQGKQDFNRKFAASESAYVDQYSAAQLELIPAWKDHPKELKKAATEQFQEEVNNVSTFFDPATEGRWSGGLEKHPQTGVKMTPQMTMIYTNSDEWASVVSMVGEVWSGKIEAAVMGGMPVSWETFNWDES